MTAAALLRPRFLDRDGIRYQINLPTWGQWLTILDRSSRGTGGADQAEIGKLLRLWLGQSVRIVRDDALFPLGPVDHLPVDLADALVEQGTAALDALADDLNLRQEAIETGVRISTTAETYVLRALSFAERNACLSRNLAVRNGLPEIDASAYEVALVAASLVPNDQGHTPSQSDLMVLPMPVGEALVSAARHLSDPAAEAELTAFANAGEPHPDLDLATLCLTYQMTPDQAQSLSAATARRLLAAARLLQSAQLVHTAPHPIEDDRVTRIVVHDD